MLYKTKAIVLHHIKYSETSIVAYLYTEVFGRQAYLIKGAYSKKASVRANLFQPLFLLDMEVYHKATSELQKIKEVKNNPIYSSIPISPVKSSVALFLAEMLYRTLREEHPNEQLFNFLFHSLQWFDVKQTQVSDFHVVFMMQLSKYLGFFPLNNYSDENKYFDLVNGKYLSLPPNHEKYLNEELSKQFSILSCYTIGSTQNILFPHDVRMKLLNVLIDYYYLHVSGMGKVKSLSVLQEVFA